MKERLCRILYNLLNPNAEKLRRWEDKLFAQVFADNQCDLISYNSPEMWRLVRQSRACRHLRDSLIARNN